LHEDTHMSKHSDERNLLRVAEAIRAACLNAALESYEEAGIRGLCHEGAWECAVGAIRGLNVRRILEQQNIYQAQHEQ
jgi:hypothetical protein